jgi:hypothetical protein
VRYVVRTSSARLFESRRLKPAVEAAISFSREVAGVVLADSRSNKEILTFFENENSPPKNQDEGSRD